MWDTGSKLLIYCARACLRNESCRDCRKMTRFRAKIDARSPSWTPREMLLLIPAPTRLNGPETGRAKHGRHRETFWLAHRCRKRWVKHLKPPRESWRKNYLPP